MIGDNETGRPRWSQVNHQWIFMLCLILNLYVQLGCDSSISSSPQTSSPCGLGDPQIFYGVDRPFIPFESTPAEWKIEYGLQGGYHIDLSFRFTGDLNPDEVDLTVVLLNPKDQTVFNPPPTDFDRSNNQFDLYYPSLQTQAQLQTFEIQDLFQSLSLPFTLFGLHNTQQWYLIFAEPEDQLQGCYFYKARIFLYTPEGMIPTASDLRPMDQNHASLWIRLSTQDQFFFWQTFGTLKWTEPSELK